MRILVTGGAGYIGSTAVRMLIEKGFDVTVLDDLSTGHRDAISSSATFIEGSILNPDDVTTALKECDAVIHFAGKSLVGESVLKPDLYWSVNVEGTRILLDGMRKAGITRMVFSSSAATYGEPLTTPILETDPTLPTNPYGATKARIDEMLAVESDHYGLSAISLRYFNVAGALSTSQGWLAERHSPETHLIPNVLRSTQENPVSVFGTDWPTSDGTCIRDYVHVVDLIEAHIKALGALNSPTHTIINLGSGRGYSVFEVIDAASAALAREVHRRKSPRREGDPAVLVADISRAKTLLSWVPTRDIAQMVLDSAHALEII